MSEIFAGIRWRRLGSDGAVFRDDDAGGEAGNVSAGDADGECAGQFFNGAGRWSRSWAGVNGIVQTFGGGRIFGRLHDVFDILSGNVSADTRRADNFGGGECFAERGGRTGGVRGGLDFDALSVNFCRRGGGFNFDAVSGRFFSIFIEN